MVDILYKLRNAKNNPEHGIETEYTIDSDILFKDKKVVILVTLQPHVLQELHASHLVMFTGSRMVKRLTTSYDLEHPESPLFLITNFAINIFYLVVAVV